MLHLAGPETNENMSYSLYGFNIETDFRFTFDLPAAAGPHDLSFSRIRRTIPRDLDPSGLLYASQSINHSGEPACMLFDAGDARIMRFPRVADFLIRPDSILCELLDPECAYLVQICLLGHVFGYYLESCDFSSIHGASLAINDSAVLLAGNRGAGKSTMAGAFLTAGVPLLADDISALDIRSDAVYCRPAYPQIKLTPEQARRFGLDASAYEKVHPAFEKLNVPMPDLGSFHSAPLPARAVYLLERLPDPSAPIRIENIPPGEALIELLRHTFISEIIEATELQVPRMKRLAQIAKMVPVKRLRYPSGYDQLPLVLEAIRADAVR